MLSDSTPATEETSFNLPLYTPNGEYHVGEATLCKDEHGKTKLSFVIELPPYFFVPFKDELVGINLSYIPAKEKKDGTTEPV